MAGAKKNERKQDGQSQEFQNFQRLLKDTLGVPKDELDKRRVRYNHERKAKHEK